MNERPIQLKAWEVRAILDGRKTQKRRVGNARELGLDYKPPKEQDHAE